MTGGSASAQWWSCDMFDIAYLATGAIFLLGCVLYVYACDVL
ncbi:MAG: hypothetical protein U1E70_01845 [Acetobacteraceae bacterium]